MISIQERVIVARVRYITKWSDFEQPKNILPSTVVTAIPCMLQTGAKQAFAAQAHMFLVVGGMLLSVGVGCRSLDFLNLI